MTSLIFILYSNALFGYKGKEGELRERVIKLSCFDYFKEREKDWEEF